MTGKQISLLKGPGQGRETDECISHSYTGDKYNEDMTDPWGSDELFSFPETHQGKEIQKGNPLTLYHKH